MPVPRYNIPRHKPSEIKVKSNYIVRMLFKVGYDIGNARDAVKFIEENGVDKFDFDYPYGSFEVVFVEYCDIALAVVLNIIRLIKLLSLKEARVRRAVGVNKTVNAEVLIIREVTEIAAVIIFNRAHG